MVTAPSVVHFRFADALRAIAIFLVVLSHICMVVPVLGFLNPYRGSLGAWGVDAFFVLSGFLLGRPYVDAVLGRAPLPDWKRYARRRFLRIWPAYAAIVLLVMAKKLVHHGWQPLVAADIGTHLLMIHNFFPDFAGGADNISLWTMAVDAQFYLALPIVAWLLYRSGARDRRTAIVRTLAAVICLSVGYRIAFALIVPGTVDLELSYQRNLIGMGTSFAAGVFLTYLDAFSIGVAPRIARPLVVLALLLTGADFALSALLPDADPFRDLLMDLTGTLSVALLIFAIRFVAWPKLDAVIGSRILAGAAANAYALYLVHVPIKETIRTNLQAHGIALGTTRFELIFCAAFCMACAVAVPLLHRFVENPFLTLKERTRETAIAAVPT